MSLLQIIFFAFLLISSVYFTLLNDTDVIIHLTRSLEYDVPVSILVLIIFVCGLVVASILSFFSNSKFRIILWRKYRKKEKLSKTYIRGLEYYISGQQKKSIPLLKKVVRENSNKSMPLTLLGNIFRSQDNIKKAIDLHQKAKSISSSDKFVQKSLEEDYQSTKTLPVQKETVKELTLPESNNLDNLFRLRDTHLKSEDWNEAIVIQNQIIPKIKDSDKRKEEKRKVSIFYYESAMGSFKNDFFQAAIQKLRNSIKEDPNFIASHILLGECYLKSGKEKKALKTWESGYQQTDDPLFLKRIDKFYIDRNQPKEVIELYQDAINKKPKVPLLHFLLGETYIRFEMFDDAMSEFQKAYAYNPDSIALNLLIGKIYERKDDFESASGEYQKAFQKELESVLKFTCGKCGFQVNKWVGRCPECKEWDINSFDIHKHSQKLLD